MNTQYFRVTAYHPAENTSVILDSNGLHEKLWQFSSALLQKGFKVIEVSSDEKFIDVNIEKTSPESEKHILRAYAQGLPENITHSLNGVTYNAIKVGEKIYIPDRDKRVNIE
jgi:hypothetical protein